MVDTNLALVVGGIVGLLIGAGLVYLWRFSEKQQTEIPPTPEPAVPPGVEAVLSVLRSSAVLVDDEERVLKASAPAHAMGLIADERLLPEELQELVRQVRRDGQVREAKITLPPTRWSLPRYVAARVAPLSSRLTLVLVEDRTRERRVESIRRDFVANVSHELKTPIGALNLLAEAVGEASDDPETVERFAGRMRRESERLTRLVQQIIELSRLQADALIEEPVEVDVHELVQTTVDRSSTEAEKKDIELVGQSEEHLYVIGDPDQILAAVSNLVENAVAYSPEGSRIAVTAKAIDSDIHITVSDQGVGIPEAELERIFERFYRVDPARARSTGGTGLGLSIVKHVTASHGGSVKVWSEPGQGSSFTLIFPAHQDADEAEPPDDAAVVTRPDLLIAGATAPKEAHS